MLGARPPLGDDLGVPPFDLGSEPQLGPAAAEIDNRAGHVRVFPWYSLTVLR